MADGVLLVTRQGVTDKNLLKKGISALEPSKLLGTVLNASTKTVHSDYYYQAPVKS
jgi:Mrp family chromosome partitioning ATPase